jgi:glycosyltransferase involved in cell wall biosynthesis
VLLLNNDVEILHEGWLEKLQEAAYADPKAGIVGCRLIVGDGRLLHAGTYIVPDTCWGQQIGSLELDLGQYADTRPVEGIVFACAYVRREVLRTVGLLSGSYESYFEDTDYCLRAAEHGFVTLCCGAVTLRHDEHGSTSGDESMRRRVFEKSRAAFRSQWESKLEKRYISALAWQSIMNVPIGYATSAREMMRVLDERGTRITYSYAYGPGTPLTFDEPEASGHHRLDVIRRRRDPRRPPVVVTYAMANVFHRNPGDYRIGFTMLEVDGFPPDWVSQANVMDEIWVPTEFNRQAMIRCGVTRPVHVIPLGIDPDHYHPGIRRVPNPSGDFVFLANFEWGERKAPEVLLRVFNETFRASEQVVLVCKTLNRSAAVDVPNEIRSLGLSDRGGRIYFLHNREMPHYQLATLYRSADCFVSPARGEGWGLPVHEAMACGVPVIATDWSGHTSLLDPEDTYPLRARAIIPAESTCPYYDGFSWADPDPHHLAELLRHVFENQDEARDKGLRASKRVRATLTWTETAKVIEGHVARITGR